MWDATGAQRLFVRFLNQVVLFIADLVHNTMCIAPRPRGLIFDKSSRLSRQNAYVFAFTYYLLYVECSFNTNATEYVRKDCRYYILRYLFQEVAADKVDRVRFCSLDYRVSCGPIDVRY
jgi:hypothetical protein